MLRARSKKIQEIGTLESHNPRRQAASFPVTT